MGVRRGPQAAGELLAAAVLHRDAGEERPRLRRRPRAATGARVRTRILTYNLHPADHPVDPAFPDGRYLKCVFARVLR